MQNSTLVAWGQILWAISPIIIFAALFFAIKRESHDRDDSSFKKSPHKLWWFDLFFVLYAFCTAYIVTSSWTWSLAAAVITAYFFLNAWAIRYAYDSITNVYKEEGRSKVTFMIFFGFPWVMITGA